MQLNGIATIAYAISQRHSRKQYIRHYSPIETPAKLVILSFAGVFQYES